jgi:hypothetical protein
MDKLKINDIIRSNRKTIALIVNSDATLTVRAPVHVSADAIDRVVRKKSLWIVKKRREAARRPKAWQKEFVNGESFLYLGKTYKLHICEGLERGIVFRGGFYLVKSPRHQARQLFIQWYKTAGARKFRERVDWYAKRMGLRYKQVLVTDARKRWGSCSVNGNLNFSWRLILAPLPVVDYVVVHELAHMEVKDHSGRFWSKVRAMIPNYQEYRDWLKVNGPILVV